MVKLMILYVSVIILAYLSYIYYPVSKNTNGLVDVYFCKHRFDIFLLVIFISMSAFSFLRTSYNDTGNYMHFFETADTLPQFFSDPENLKFTKNPLSYLYQTVMHELTDNYHVYFLFPAAFNTYVIVKLFKRFSVNIPFSFIIFFCIGSYISFIAALKQSIALSVLLLSIPYAIEKKYIRFYLLVFLAILFHTHAFMFAIIPFLFHKPWSKPTYILLIITIFAMCTYDYTFGAFMRYAQSIGAFVAEDEVFDGHSINGLRVMVYAVVPLIAWLFRKRLFSNASRSDYLFVNMSIISCFILSIGLINGANLYARMASYFEVAQALALPWMLHKLFEPNSRKFIYIVASICFTVYFIIDLIYQKNFDAQYRAISMWQFIISLFGFD